MSKYNLTLDSQQMGLILKVLNLRGNQLMSRHTKGADFELGSIDALTDYLSDVMIQQSDFYKSDKGVL
jgi:hypothetical protein